MNIDTIKQIIIDKPGEYSKNDLKSILNILIEEIDSCIYFDKISYKQFIYNFYYEVNEKSKKLNDNKREIIIDILHYGIKHSIKLFIENLSENLLNIASSESSKIMDIIENELLHRGENESKM